MGAPGGDYYDPVQQGISPQTQAVEVVPPKPDIAKDIVISVGEYVGYWPLLGVLVLGVLVLFRTRIRKAARAFLKGDKKDG